MLADATSLWKTSLPDSAAVVALGAVPVSVVAALVFWATGITSQETLNEAIKNGETARALPLFAVGLLNQLVLTLVVMALTLVAESRRIGARLTAREAYSEALDRFVPFALTGLRALVWVFLGFFVFVVPGIWAALLYSLVPYAVLLDGLRGKDALARSAALVKGEPKRALGYTLAAYLVTFALQFAALLALSVAIGFLQAVAGGGTGAFQGQLKTLLAQLLTGLAASWTVSFGVLLYRDLASGQPAQ